MKDITIHKLIKAEEKRQNEGLELIASENFASKAVRKVMSSCLTNKYAEGYPEKRYYGGCTYIDMIENLAIANAKLLFDCSYANVQPHSGSQANAAAYRALEKYLISLDKLKDRKMKILTMDLNSGSHLTHGSKVSFSSNLYDFSFFNLSDSGKLDFDIIEQAIKDNKPDIILAGYSAYSYNINFTRFKELATQYDCLFMVDMAHIAGIVAAKLCQNPCHSADIVTSTTHKTLRGPRGGLILTNNKDLNAFINSAVFPYYQGGPLEHVIAAKAVCFEEALQPEFTKYISRVLTNTKVFTNRLKRLGAICSDTDNHLMLLNTKKTFGMTGLLAQNLLEDIGITVNKNMLVNDTETPKTTSGLRIGFAALTTRGLTTIQAKRIADIIYCYLKTYDCLDIMENITIDFYRKKVKEIVKTLKKI